MKFKDHLAAGAIVATMTTAALGFEVLVFPVTLFFSLFPDLDTASIPQRWSYRAITLGLMVLAYYGLYQEAVALAVVAMLPLLDRHRGWTHRVWAPLLFPGVAIAVYSFVVLHTGPLDVQWEQQFTQNWKLFAGLVLGWYTHLLLDSKHFVST